MKFVWGRGETPHPARSYHMDQMLHLLLIFDVTLCSARIQEFGDIVWQQSLNRSSTVWECLSFRVWQVLRLSKQADLLSRSFCSTCQISGKLCSRATNMHNRTKADLKKPDLFCLHFKINEQWSAMFNTTGSWRTTDNPSFYTTRKMATERK